MAALDPSKSTTMQTVAAFVIVAFTSVECFITIAPYFGFVANAGDAVVIQQQTLVQTIIVAIIGFLFGASVGTQKKDDTIQTLSNTAATAQAALTPAAPAVVIQPGGSATVAASESPNP